MTLRQTLYLLLIPMEPQNALLRDAGMRTHRTGTQVQADSSTITFGADIDPYHLASVNSSLFNDYWSDYVSDLYSENRRILQIEAILPAGKIISMNLKNAIMSGTTTNTL
jgi:hypothetical protein